MEKSLLRMSRLPLRRSASEIGRQEGLLSDIAMEDTLSEPDSTLLEDGDVTLEPK